MRSGGSLVVDGPVTRDMLVNLAAFQEAWACWRPELYRPDRNFAPENLRRAHLIGSESGDRSVFRGGRFHFHYDPACNSFARQRVTFTRRIL